MKHRNYKVLASFAVACGVICFLGATPSVQAGANGGGLINGGSVTVPDAGATSLLLALGGSGLAIAARMRFKK